MTHARFSFVIVLLAAAASAPVAQTRDAPRSLAFDSAFFAWERGDYPAALAGFERILAASDGERFAERIAVITGELYRTTPVAPDGQNLRWSADGRFASFTTNGGRTTHIVAVESDTIREVASFPGVALAFAPAGNRVAYLAVDETPELRRARALADSLLRAQEFGRFQRQRQEVTRLEQATARVMTRDLRTGATQELTATGFAKRGLAFGADGATLYVVGGPANDRARADLYALSASAPPRAMTSGPGLKANPVFAAGGRVVFTIGGDSVAVRDVATGAGRTFPGTSPAVSADGSTLAFLSRGGGEWMISVVALGSPADPVIVKRSVRPIATPVPSPDGGRIAHAVMLRDDWELFVVGRDGRGDTRLSREIQHDVLPRWLGNDRIMAIKGEPRHRRSYMYDAATGDATR
ncbi:MAG: TolB family protein, partial [Gemmatimonadaceae bacterium]